MSATPEGKSARDGKSRKWRRVLIISSVFIITPPILGLLGTVLGMIGAFRTLNVSGGSDPEALAGDISFALYTTAGGLIISTIALIPFTISLIAILRGRKRPPAIPIDSP